MITVDEAMNHARNELERAFEKWLTDECPSGDCESVQRQWDDSFAHQELVDELQPVMVLTFEVHQLREQAANDSIQIELLEHKLESFREENERLKADAERLGWIGRQYLQDFCMMLVVDADHDGEYYVEGDDNQKGYGLTLRDAIDAARGAK